MGEGQSTSGSDHCTGQYTLVPIVQTPKIDPGDTIKIDIYLLGAGEIDDNRLDVVYEFDNLINPKDRGEAESAVAIDIDGNIKTGEDPIQDDLIKTNYELPTTGRRFSFSERLINNNPNSETDFPPSKLGQSHDGNAPLRLNIQTDGNADPGDYALPLIFTYKAGDEIRQTQHHANIYVKSWVERHKIESTIAVIISGIVAVFTFISSFGPCG